MCGTRSLIINILLPPLHGLIQPTKVLNLCVCNVYLQSWAILVAKALVPYSSEVPTPLQTNCLANTLHLFLAQTIEKPGKEIPNQPSRNSYKTQRRKSIRNEEGSVNYSIHICMLEGHQENSRGGGCLGVPACGN